MNNGDKMNILVIDDDPHILKFITAILTDRNHNVTTKPTPEEAFTDFTEAGYELVITDIFMDGMGGIDGITKIREIDENVPIIAISAGYKKMPPDKALRAAHKIGANIVLAKPFTEDELATVISALLIFGTKGDQADLPSW